jgi:hypothetical protein
MAPLEIAVRGRRIGLDPADVVRRALERSSIETKPSSLLCGDRNRCTSHWHPCPSAVPRPDRHAAQRGITGLMSPLVHPCTAAKCAREMERWLFNHLAGIDQIVSRGPPPLLHNLHCPERQGGQEIKDVQTSGRRFEPGGCPLEFPLALRQAFDLRRPTPAAWWDRCR